MVNEWFGEPSFSFARLQKKRIISRVLNVERWEGMLRVLRNDLIKQMLHNFLLLVWESFHLNLNWRNLWIIPYRRLRTAKLQTKSEWKTFPIS